jgi:hypothetical protein
MFICPRVDQEETNSGHVSTLHKQRDRSYSQAENQKYEQRKSEHTARPFFRLERTKTFHPKPHPVEAEYTHNSCKSNPGSSNNRQQTMIIKKRGVEEGCWRTP